MRVEGSLFLLARQGAARAWLKRSAWQAQAGVAARYVVGRLSCASSTGCSEQCRACALLTKGFRLLLMDCLALAAVLRWPVTFSAASHSLRTP